MKKVFFAATALLCLLGCSKKSNNQEILGREKMQAVMWDVIGADVFTEQFVKKDSSKNAVVENVQLQNKIFALHNVSRARYYKSFDYYVAHTELMKTLLDSMTAKAETDRPKMIQEQHGGGPATVK